MCDLFDWCCHHSSQKKHRHIPRKFAFPDLICLPPPPNGPCTPDNPIAINPTSVVPVTIVPNGDTKIFLALVEFSPPVQLNNGAILNITVKRSNGEVFGSSNFNTKVISGAAVFASNPCPITSGTVIFTVGNCSRTFPNVAINCPG